MRALGKLHSPLRVAAKEFPKRPVPDIGDISAAEENVPTGVRS